MGWGEAMAAIFSVAKTVLDRMWGSQTSEQDSLEAQADHAARERRAALDGGDLDAANFWAGELRRLHDEIAAKRG